MTGAIILNVTFLLLIAGNIIMYVLTGRLQKKNAKTTQTWVELIDNARQLCETAKDRLLEAAYTGTAAQHQRYTADEASIPGKIAVKCEDCGEQVGLCDSRWEVRDLAEKHVADKYADMGETAKRLTRDNLQAMLDSLEESK